MEKRKKLDLDALGYNENFACPKCKKMISFYFFLDKFATQIGVIKDALEDDYNADPEFAEFVFEDNSFDEVLNEQIGKFVKKRLKEYHKYYKQGKIPPYYKRASENMD